MSVSYKEADSYEAVEEYLLEMPKFTTKNSLEDTRRFLELLGAAGEDRKVIHVAGTNGKGSVCAYLCCILKAAGYSVGMFTSPHLIEMRERFRINGTPVDKNKFTKAFHDVMGQLGRVRETEGKSGYHPTFFELLFLMGMVIFQQESVDYIILETGLGGRLDATNVVKSPLVTVITEIGLDHMEYLGDTIEQIAGEKAGILKPSVPVVFSDKRKEASKVIRERAQMLGNRAVAVSESDWINRKFRNKSIDFSMYSRYYDYIRLKLTTPALYQAENAAIAVRCIEELPDRRNILKEHIQTGIRDTVWEGRMEEAAPGIIVDGAHNEDGIRAFVQTVEADGCSGKRYLLFSAVADKDYKAMIRILDGRKLFDIVVISRIRNKRAAEPEILKQIFAEDKAKECIFIEDTENAFDYLVSRKKKEDHIYIAGSLYLVGEIKELLRRRTDD